MKISGGGKHRTSLIQFASQYRVKKQNREKQREEAYEKTVGEIDPISNVGPDSPDFIAGDHNRMAPTSMRLRNGKIMVKRDGVNDVCMVKGQSNSRKFCLQKYKYVELHVKLVFAVNFPVNCVVNTKYY